MADALFVDTLRGFDSTGVLEVTWSGENKCFMARVEKDTTPGPEFIRDHIELLRNDGPAWGMIGHNRAATKGNKKIVENAHPFDVMVKDEEKEDTNRGWVVGVHNGTVSQLASTAEHEVDSYNLLHSIADKGPDVALPAIVGPYALAWYDMMTSEFNFSRNAGRPLHCAFSPNGRNMYIMSEAEMLYDVLRRNKMAIKNDQIFRFDVNNRYSLTVKGGEILNLVKTQLPMYRGKLVSATPPPPPRKDDTGWSQKIGGGSGITGNVSDYPPSGHDPINWEDLDAMTSDILKKDYDIYPGKIEMFYITGWDTYPSTYAMGKLNLCVDVYNDEDVASLGNRAEPVMVEARMERCHTVAYDEWRNAANFPFKVKTVWVDDDGDLRAVVEALSENEFMAFLETNREDFWNEGDTQLPTLEGMQGAIRNYQAETDAYEQDRLEEALALVGGSDVMEYGPQEEEEEEDPILFGGPGGTRIDQKKWDGLTKNGCGWCQADIFTCDEPDLEWQGDSPICKQCAFEHGEMIGLVANSTKH